jgi:hypothetical protein
MAGNPMDDIDVCINFCVSAIENGPEDDDAKAMCLHNPAHFQKFLDVLHTEVGLCEGLDLGTSTNRPSFWQQALDSVSECHSRGSRTS